MSMSMAFAPPRLQRSFRTRAVSSVLFGLFVAALFGAIGCGSKSDGNSVSGKVTLNGVPVSGVVVFVTADQKKIEAPTNPDGTYQIINPPLGSVKVTVKPMPAVTGTNAPPPKDAPSMGAGAGAKGVSPPAKYASDATTDLTYEVKAGKNTYDIPLK